MTESSAAAAAPATDLTLEQAGALAPLASPDQAGAKVAAGAFLIDVRPDATRAKQGTMQGATVVDRNNLDALFDVDSADRLAGVVDKDTPIVVACGSVRGSGPVAAVLRDKGFTDVVHVEGGFPGWQAAGLPSGPPTATDR